LVIPKYRSPKTIKGTKYFALIGKGKKSNMSRASEYINAKATKTP
jgi:hypothetical protein